MPPGAVHIWQIGLEQPAALLKQLEQLLSSDEQARAAHYHFERDRRRFIVARAILRSLLASYTNRLATQIRFSYSRSGKPALAEGSGAHLSFNLAHSEEVALYAFALEHEIGVDVEQVRALDDALQIAQHYFSPRERALLAALSGPERYQAFFSYWTRKEAYLKACGEGLALLNTQLDVLGPAGQPVRLADRSGAADWFVYDLNVASGYRGALSLRQSDTKIVYCQPSIFS